VIVDKKRRTYAAMMFALDRGVGRIRSWLRDSGQLDNTLIVFFSDNGGATNNGSWNGTLSGVKGCLREGGVRVPMIWSWPDQIPAGRTVSGVVSSLDLLPTFLAAAKSEPLGLKPPLTHYDGNNRKRAAQLYGAYDGINLLPILQQEAEAPERLLFWRLQGQAAVLDGEHKLIRLGHRPAQVFRPSSDLSERNDLAADSPEIFRHLFHRLGEWEAALPTVPLWGSSPYWNGQSAKHYDNWETRSEPK
jgi:arylsulfatase A-like enzyme